jgi:6-phosphogluconolactonase
VRNVDIKRFPSPDALAEGAAADWLKPVRAADRRQIIAFSGGRIARTFFEATARLARAQNVSLNQIEFFWADERCVPADSDDSNFKLAKVHLLDPAGVPPVRIHPLAGAGDGVEISRRRSEELKQLAPLNEAGVPVFDLIFLGMGEDGHVASLFPGESEADRNRPDIYRPVIAVKPPPQRITLGYPVLAAAREVWVLASGAGKAKALEESLKPDGHTPLARVIQSRRQTRIYSDIPER